MTLPQVVEQLFFWFYKKIDNILVPTVNISFRLVATGLGIEHSNLC